MYMNTQYRGFTFVQLNPNMYSFNKLSHGIKWINGNGNGFESDISVAYKLIQHHKG